MNTLHLFAGIGGGIVADMMMGHKPVGAVELNSFCRRVLHQRQADGWLPDFPIFNDVKNFDGRRNITPEYPLFEGTEDFNDGYEITEPVDVICGGFPCQSFSTAGDGRGFDDARGQLFFDHSTFSWKTYPPCSPAVAAPFSGKFPVSGMMRSGAVYPLKIAVPGTGATGGGACAGDGRVPTPTVKGNFNYKGCTPTSRDGLETYVRKFPTPTTTDACKGNGSGQSNQRRVSPGLAVTLATDAECGQPPPPATPTAEAE